jgi:hypothetical protein
LLATTGPEQLHLFAVKFNVEWPLPVDTCHYALVCSGALVASGDGMGSGFLEPLDGLSCSALLASQEVTRYRLIFGKVCIDGNVEFGL